MTPEAFTAELVEAARQVVKDTTGERFATARRIHESLAREHRHRQRRIKFTALALATACGFAVLARYAGWQPAPTPTGGSATASAPPAERVRPADRAAHVPAPALSRPVPTPEPVAPTPALVPPAPEPVSPVPTTTPPPAPVSPAHPRTPVSHVPASILTPAPVPPAPAPVPPAPVPPGSIIAPGPSTQRPTGPPVIQTAPPTADPSRSGEPERSTPPTPEAATELQRYRRAHEAHFHGSDPAAALAAWDAYLASYPNGQLAIEAQFSRALVLIKLERWTDAAAALRPFASAPPGSYRQAEAARLIEAIPGH